MSPKDLHVEWHTDYKINSILLTVLVFGMQGTSGLDNLPFLQHQVGAAENFLLKFLGFGVRKMGYSTSDMPVATSQRRIDDDHHNWSYFSRWT